MNQKTISAIPAGKSFGGLSGTALKLIALVSMLLDHIAYFFDFTGVIPMWFGMAGRLAAPLFMFCLAEGFAHTRNRKRYFLRIYAIAAAMGGVQFLMKYGGIGVRGDGFYPQNGIMTLFALLLIVWQGMDWIKARRWVRGLLAVLLPLAWPFACPTIAGMMPARLGSAWGFALYSVLPTWGMIGDTSMPVLVMGLLMYPLRGHRVAQALSMAAWAVFYHFGIVYTMASAMPGFALSQMFTVYVEWMGAFAAPLMLCYNGQRGRGMKGLFYAFYPGHIAALYALSCLVYRLTVGR